MSLDRAAALAASRSRKGQQSIGQFDPRKLGLGVGVACDGNALRRVQAPQQHKENPIGP